MLKKTFKSLLTQSSINNLYHRPKAILANIAYGFPTRGMKVIGVSGTDGKTTTVNMVYKILKDSGKKVSMISTINAVTSGKSYDTGFHVTSPDPFMVQKFASSAKQNGDEYLVLEVTSHALDQFRFWGIKFDIGVITNITHEHLDYHQTLENYTRTKLKLIQNVKYAIINNNLKTIAPYPENNCTKIFTFGLQKGDFNQKKLNLKLQIPGDYNIENALAAFAVCSSLGIDQIVCRKALEGFGNLTGRMQSVKNKRGIKVFIDFAHTPNGLEQVLKSLRFQITSGRIIAVFGSAGNRDTQKRELMGSIAAKSADFLVVTAEDPRGELNKISQQITDGAIKAGAKLNKNLFIINNREKAIHFAINKLSKKGDVVGIFGKGHEMSMNLDGKKEIPWSDFEAVERVLNG